MTTRSASISQVRYDKLMATAKSRPRPDGYIELHHIIPRSAGGSDTADNLVVLTAREHFLAHWLLYRIYRTPAAARAFKLMVHVNRKPRGRDYALARRAMADSMRGDRNVSRRPEVRKKLRENPVRYFAGKTRPEHSALMKARGHFVGKNNPSFGKGERQRGVKNHMARRVVGLHPWYGISAWSPATAAAQALGVTIQAVAQAVRKQQRSRGWRLEYSK